MVTVFVFLIKTIFYFIFKYCFDHIGTLFCLSVPDEISGYYYIIIVRKYQIVIILLLLVI